jgi:hypothetical protein
MIRKIINTVVLLTFVTAGISVGQEDKISWKRQETTKLGVHLFHSPHVFNLPTTETLQAGDLEFEISHRFFPTINSGFEDFWGLDGPVFNRLALGYGITDKTDFTIGRSNLNDNVDFRLKREMFEFSHDLLPSELALAGGLAWNTDVFDRDTYDSKNFQYYGQLVINTLYKEVLGIGLVPSYLYNSDIFSDETKYSFTSAVYLQYYFMKNWSLVYEWNFLISGYRSDYNPVSIGVEIETGGHFFKILLSNSSDLNPSQYLTGADLNVAEGDWRLGFMITRLLSF